MMHLLFIGDVVGKTGRNSLRQCLPGIYENYRIDLTIANGENSAGGAGITHAVYVELRNMGIDVITGGNHSWDQKEVLDFIDHEPGLIRPANYPPDTTPGEGSVVIEPASGGPRIAVINLIGRVFMRHADCPFRTADREISLLKDKADFIVVDFHAEATSEKEALGWYLDGRVSAVIGTHSHVQTADERILPAGTAYITDVGMAGLYNSILGVDKEGPLQRFLTQMPHKLTISEGKKVFNAVIIELDEKSGKAIAIERIYRII